MKTLRMVLEETDQQLIEACRRGDAGAFRSLFEIHKDRVYSIALRYCGDRAAAMDVAQEVFLKLFSALPNFRGDSRFESWLYRIVVNCCFDYKRKTLRLGPLVGELIGLLRSPGESALHQMMRDQLGESVRTAVSALPPEQRIAVVLRYTEGLSYDEIAEAVGSTPGTIASRLNRAHKVLGKRLARVVGVTGERHV
jgi:RNA polymerase sigma-70 factor, ECF subfamily